ncbi:MAG: hypothetical protein AAB529_00900 [Patescibacteria group bacterium]
MKFFYSIIKQKKILVFVVLISIIAGVITPQSAHASVKSCVWGVLVGSVAAIATGIITAGGASIPVGAAIIVAGCAGGHAIEKAATEGQASFFIDLIAGVADIIYSATHIIAVISSNLLTAVVTSDFLNKSILAESVYQQGWTMVRNLANMFIVLGFVVIGIAFTLRIGEYGSKKVLINLILIALLVNFSGLFSGLIIDASNILTKEFLLKGGNNAGTFIVTAIEKVVAANDWDAIYDKDVRTYLAWDVFYSVYYIMTAIVFFYLSFILFARNAIFAVLFVLSPLAFFCWIFPATKKLWTMWWENFIKWGLIGAQVGFFTWVAASILTTTLTLSLNVIITVLVLLYVAITVAKKSSAIGASAVMGLAGGALGFAMGATGKISKFAAGATGLSRAGAAVKDKATATGERIGLVSKGTTAQNQAKRLEKSTKRLDNIQDNQQLAKIAEQRAITHEQAQDKAAAAQILAKRNAFSAVDPRKRDAVAAHAAAFGVSKDTFTKVRPETFAETTDPEATQRVRDYKAKEYEEGPLKIPPEKARKLASEYAPTLDETKRARFDLRQQKITENSLGITPLTDRDIQNKVIENKQKEYIDLAKSKGKEMLPEEALKLAKNHKPSAYEMTSVRESLSQERIAKGIQKLSPIKASELPEEAVNGNTAHLFSARQLREIGDKGGTNLINQVAKFKGKIYTDPSTGKKTFSGGPQSPEFTKIQAYYKTLPPGREKDQLKEAMVELATNRNI